MSYYHKPLTGFALFRRNILDWLGIAAQFVVIGLGCVFIAAIFALPFLWYGGIIYVFWHFIAKVW